MRTYDSENYTRRDGMHVQHTTLDADMAAFDALPPRIRTLLNYLPDRLAAGPLARAFSRDAARANARLSAELAAAFPEWHPFPSDPDWTR